MEIAYHYCAIKQMPDGNIEYNDGCLKVDRPLQANDLDAVRAKIAQNKRWENGGFNIISLTRL